MSGMDWEELSPDERSEEAKGAAQVGYTLLTRPMRTWRAGEVRRVARALWMAAWTLDHDPVVRAARLHAERMERRAKFAEHQVEQARQLADRQASHRHHRVRGAGMDMLVQLGVPRETVLREYGHVECSTTNLRHCPKHGHCTCPPGLDPAADIVYRNPSCPLHGLNNTTHPERQPGQ